MQDTRYLIAGLKADPGYMALCDYLQAQVDNMADELADAAQGPEALRLLRVWQVSRRIVGVLKTAPEDIKASLDSEKLRDSLDSMGAWREPDPSEMFERRMPVPPPVIAL